MYILAQHGWGKSDKIERGLADNSLSGAILSPRDEKMEKLQDYITQLTASNHGADVILDPQFYYVTFQNSKDGNLSEYPYYPGYHGPSSFRGSKNTRGFIFDTLSYQNGINVNYLTAPSIHINSFSSREAQIMLNFAQEAVDIKEEKGYQKPLLLSLAIHENAFSDKRLMEDFLDELSMIQADGIYMIICRNPGGYHQSFDDSTKLANILSFIYSLTEINGFKMFLGFSDFLGILYLSVGASKIATGWSQGLRRFTLDRISPINAGGRRPRPRYSSGPLLNSILTSELDSILQSRLRGQYDDFLSGTRYDALIRHNPLDGWDDTTSTLHHWSCLEIKAQNLFNNCADISERLDSLQGAISYASGLYAILNAAHIQLDPKSNGNHLDVWNSALTEFRQDVSV
ncbi:hypothetical protein [Paenibacillus sp. GP183]|uniref:hypothetical protein n=1 Tax=Paenibacillus sp. GP183 TaxID=1882751 RepID=UPI00089BA02E|nr:hypothetical protein [Paenibacillus sp. GP183]SED14679.1 hypothetical protein SAMN05443246_5900 [Paenibacillus sp. GP183]